MAEPIRVLHYTAARALDRAAALIEVPGQWTQHVDARNGDGEKVPPDHPTAACWCANGAISHVLRGMFVRELDPRRINATVNYACDAVCDSLPFPDVGTSLAVWNDDQTRTAAEVARGLRRGAQRIRAFARKALRRKVAAADFDHAPGETVHGQAGRDTIVVRYEEPRSSLTAVYYAIYARRHGVLLWYAERGAGGLALDVAEAWGWRGEVPTDAEVEGRG